MVTGDDGPWGMGWGSFRGTASPFPPPHNDDITELPGCEIPSDPAGEASPAGSETESGPPIGFPDLTLSVPHFLIAAK